MKTLFAAMLLLSAAAAPALASHKSDVMSTIKHYNDDFNKGDMKSANALCTAQTMIIDDFAPHAWQGANTCQDWSDALTAFEKKNGITGDVVTLGKPWHVAVTGDRGYAVYPTTYSYKMNGKPVLEKGVWTFAMQKAAEGWRIAGWAWAQH